MRKRSILAPAIIFAAVLTASGDVIKLSPAGVTALRTTGIALPLTDASGYYIRGRIVVQRDAAGRLTLRDPGIFFMFEPMTAANKYGAARQMRWSWVASSKQEIDTIEDLRAIVSNRDQKYGGLDAALIEILRQIDQDDSIYHTRSLKPAAGGTGNNSVFVTEGWLTRNLIAGAIPDLAEMQAYIARVQNSLPRTDPMSYRPNDPLLVQNGGTRETMIELLEAIARAKKYGEPEKGFLAAARRVAAFISDDLYPSEDSHSGPSRDRAGFFLNLAVEARRGLTTQIGFIRPQALTSRLARPSRLGNTLEAKLRVERSHIAFDEPMPITIFDVADAAVVVAGGYTLPRSADGGSEEMLRSLLFAASGRSDLRAVETGTSFPGEVTSMANALGKNAFDVVVGLARDKTDPAAAFHRRLLIAILCDTLAMSLKDRAGDPSLVAATTQAMIETGISGSVEVVMFVDALWDTGIALVANERPWTTYAVKALKGINVDPASRATYDRYVSKRINDLKQKQDAGGGSPEERRWLERLG